jgi:hypothetical protein
MRKPTKPTTVPRRRLLEPMIIGGLLILGPAACSAPGMEDAAAEVDTGGLGRDGNGKGQGPSYTPSSATPNLATSGAPSGSDPDGPAPTTSNPDPRNCTLTQGFWKNHASVWPVSQHALGQRTYSKKELLSIFHQPVNGNGLVSLSHQLIAARLNLALGAAPDGLAAVLAEADALIGSLVVPPVGKGWLPTEKTSATNDALTAFNEGRVGPGHCDDGPKPTPTPPPPVPPFRRRPPRPRRRRPTIR